MTVYLICRDSPSLYPVTQCYEVTYDVNQWIVIFLLMVLITSLGMVMCAHCCYSECQRIENPLDHGMVLDPNVPPSYATEIKRQRFLMCPDASSSNIFPETSCFEFECDGATIYVFFIMAIFIVLCIVICRSECANNDQKSYPAAPRGGPPSYAATIKRENQMRHP